MIPELREIPSAPGYLATEDGRVFTTRPVGWHARMPNARPCEPRELRPSRSRPNGYLGVSVKNAPLRINCRVLVHAAVAEAWLGPRPKGTVVCHNDGNPLNNHASNLRYATQTENLADALAHGTRSRGSKHGRARLTEADVLAVRRALRAGASQAALARNLGVARQTITNIATGARWRHLTEQEGTTP